MYNITVNNDNLMLFRCFRLYIENEFWYVHSIEEMVIWTVEKEKGYLLSNIHCTCTCTCTVYACLYNIIFLSLDNTYPHTPHSLTH